MLPVDPTDLTPAAVRHHWSANPRAAMALRAALAAALAWGIAHLVPGPVADYPYYAPLGAVIATTSSLAASVRDAVQAVAAITLGAVVALVVEFVSPADLAPLTVAVAVALGVALAGWDKLGAMGGWVPTACLFTLILGREDPVGFIGAYSGLTLLGAVIGIALTWLWPPLPITPARLALEAARQALAGRLLNLADGLDRDTPPGPEEWDERRRDLAPLLRRMRDAVQDSRDAQRWNRRTAHWNETLERQDRQARALERAALLVEDLSLLVTEEEHAEVDEAALGKDLRPPAAEALRRLAAVLHRVEGRSEHSDDVDHARAAIAELAGAVQTAREHGQGTLVASSLVVSLRRCLQAVTDPPRRPV